MSKRREIERLHGVVRSCNCTIKQFKAEAAEAKSNRIYADGIFKLALEARDERIEQLRKALEAIAIPKLGGWVFTSQKAQDEKHCEVLIEWLNSNVKLGYTICAGSFYSLVIDVAEQALKGQ